MKKSELKKIIKEEINNLMETERNTEINAKELYTYLKFSKGDNFKANWTGAWDMYNVNNVKMVVINRGYGFEDAVSVEGSDKGMFIYMPPFTLANKPTDKEMLLFYADDAIYIKNKQGVE